MAPKWRMLDTGPRCASENIALDSALLELRANGDIPNTLRFLQFSPPAVLIGYHQTIEHEVRKDYCKMKGIDINRRITGGGAIYFDSSQLGWEIIGSRKEMGYRLDSITEKLAKGVVLGLLKLGISANFRPRNDIEVGGRKISGTGGIFEGDAFLFQGTLLIDFDVKEMIRALRIPVEKLSRHEIDSAHERVTWLSREIGRIPELEEIKGALAEGLKEALGIEFEEGKLTPLEIDSLEKKLPHFSSKEWIEEIREPLKFRQVLKSSLKAKGGLIKVHLVVDIKRRILKQALITGDFFISPKRTILDLEATLKDTPFDRVEEKIKGFFEEKNPQMPGLTPQDFLLPIKEAMTEADYVELGFSFDEANALHSINGSLLENLKAASILLLPYCAKLIECKYRNREGCEECGRCTIGDAYHLAREHGLHPITIQNFEHLRDVLNSCQREGVVSYIGCCCEAFFNNKQRIFREARMGGVLVDIEDTTCYELKQEEKAMMGEFTSQTNLRIQLLNKITKIRANG